MAALGMSDRAVRQVLPVSDMKRHYYVRLGTWTAADAEELLRLLPKHDGRT